jgi:hypothetical protein
MRLKGTGYVVLPDEATGRRGREGWPAMLRRWLVECPQCAEVWLVVGVRENDRHVCKDCGHSFAVRFSRPSGGSLSALAGEAQEEVRS